MDFLFLKDVFKVSGTVCGLVGALVSLGLIFFPNQLLKLNNLLNKEISTDKLRLALEKQFDITSLVMQARFVAGVIIFLLSLILIAIAVKL
jgi:hypothetical protein